MDVLSVLRACGRRWYVALVVVGGGLVFGMLQYQRALPVFTMSAQMIVLSNPTQSARSAGVRVNSNPYAGQLAIAADAVSRTATSRGALAGLRAQGYKSTFATSVSQQGVIISITATDTKLKGLPASLAAFGREVKNQFQTLQLVAGAPRDQFLQLQMLGSPDGPVVAYPKRARALATIIVGAAVLAGLAALAVDGSVLSLRASRRNRLIASQRAGLRSHAEPTLSTRP